jgi:hypothetical protein
VPSAARRRGGPRCPEPGRSKRPARPSWPGLPPCSRASTARGSPAPPGRPPPSRPSAAGRVRDHRRRRVAPPLRHPGTASKRSAGRRIRDPCLAAPPRDPVHDEAAADHLRAARPSAPLHGRSRRHVGTASSSVAPPPSVVASRRHLRPHFVGWRTDRHLTPILQPHAVGGGAERSEAEGGPAAPSRDGERSARRTWRADETLRATASRINRLHEISPSLSTPPATGPILRRGRRRTRAWAGRGGMDGS